MKAISREERLRARDSALESLGVSDEEYEERVRAREEIMAGITYEELIRALSVAHWLQGCRL